MKKILLSALTMLTLSTAVYAELTVSEKWNKLEGIRFDYLDKEGNRIWSKYFNNNSFLFSAYPEDYSAPEKGFNVYGNGTDTFKSIKTIPWGVNNYELNVDSEDQEVDFAYTPVELNDTNGDGKIDYDDIDFSKINLPKAKRARAAQEEIKCGTHLLFSFDIPEGTYPVVSVNHEYSDFVYDGKPVYTDIRLPMLDNLFNIERFFYGGWYAYPEQRNEYLNTINTNGVFYPDPAVKNRWHYLQEMANEPMNVKFSYDRLDDATISRIIDGAAFKVYCAFGNYSNIQAPFFTGEPWTMAKCGEAFSQDCIANMAINVNPLLVSHEFYNSADYWMSQMPWIYYYGMVETANSRLYLLDHLQFDSDERLDEVRGVMRALRGNAYLRLLQLYGPRWEDSDGGSALVVPLCAELGKLDLPAASMAEIRDFAKADLEYAISALEGKKYAFSNVPTADVARGLLIRLSMLCHDWQTVEMQSAVLLNKYPLTTNEEMKAGFFTPTSSWIWNAQDYGALDSEGSYVGFFSFASSCAINGGYPLVWNIGSAVGSIDRDLFLKIPATDIRRNMFVMPEVLPSDVSSYFYNSSSVDDYSLSLSGIVKRRAINFINQNMPSGVDRSPEEDYDRSANLYFGSQLKFWGKQTGTFSMDDHVCLMRTEEILLSRAEALMESGNESGARALLNQLNSMRNPEGAPSMASGTALRDEIRLARRIELWGEGHSFFDFKRWNLPINRRAWTQNDMTSGNWPAQSAGNVSPSDYNGWRYAVPSLVRKGSRAPMGLGRNARKERPADITRLQPAPGK